MFDLSEVSRDPRNFLLAPEKARDFCRFESDIPTGGWYPSGFPHRSKKEERIEVTKHHCTLYHMHLNIIKYLLHNFYRNFNN